MFVSQSKYDKVVQQRNEEQKSSWYWNNQYQKLQTKWNDLVEQINSKGGQSFLDGNVKTTVKTQFSDTDLRSLLQLVHPDKHNGKLSAVTMTQKINALRK